MAYPLLIAKKKGQRILQGYKLGWLIKDKHDAYWMIWNKCGSLKTALRTARDTLHVMGDRDVFISDKPVSQNLTNEQVECLEKISVW